MNMCKKLWKKIYNWLFPVPTPEEFEKLTNSKYFMGIKEDPQMIEKLKQLLEEKDCK